MAVQPALIRRALLAAGLLTAAPAWATVSVTIENPNARGHTDRYEVYDMVCGRMLGTIGLGGRRSDTLDICDTREGAGELRVRYLGELQWQDFPALRNGDRVELPGRPKTMHRPKPGSNGSD